MVSIRSIHALVVGAFLSVLSTVWPEAFSALAQTAPAAYGYQQVYGEGFADSAEVRSALGTLTFSLTECHNTMFGNPQRSVGVTSERPNYENHRLVETVLYRAVQYAWQECPLHFLFAGSPMAAFKRNVAEVDFFLPDGELAVRAINFYGDDAFNPGKTYRWGSVDDIVQGQRRRAQAAAAAVIREQNETQARLLAIEARDARQMREFWNTIDTLFWIIALPSLAIFMFKHREAIVRWYFFTFHPHPAEPAVRAALFSGTVLDGKALANILGEPAGGSSTFRAVRAAQANALIDQMHAMTRRQMREMEARAKEQHETAAVQQMQAALAEAAIALERAKAFLNASKRT